MTGDPEGAGGHGDGAWPRPSVSPRVVSRQILAGDTLVAARALLGARLVRDPEPSGDDRRSGRIVEVEAYVGPDDLASHARMGPTPRNRVMFGPPGIAYVYLVYGMHHCLNVVTEPARRPGAVLIRAVEPIEGIRSMRFARERPRGAGRGIAPGGGRHVPDARLAAGPGLVGLAFGLDRTVTGMDLCDPASPLRLEARPDGEPEPEVLTSRRIGVAYAGEPWAGLPWRFLVAGSPSVSRPA